MGQCADGFKRPQRQGREGRRQLGTSSELHNAVVQLKRLQRRQATQVAADADAAVDALNRQPLQAAQRCCPAAKMHLQLHIQLHCKLTQPAACANCCQRTDEQ